MKRKSRILLFGVLLILLAVMCGDCGRNIQQQEAIQMNAESTVWTTEQESNCESIETESASEIMEVESATEIMVTGSVVEAAEVESTIEATEAESVGEATEAVGEVETVETERENETTEQENNQTFVEYVKSKFEIVSEEIGLCVDCVELDLPDVQNPYELLFINDMHVLKLDESVVAEKVERVKMRQDVMFRTDTGMASADAWLGLSSILDDFSADGVIFGGDMMDFVSTTNVQILSEGLSQITTPYIYLRADHDLATWYSGGAMNGEDAMALHTSISSYPDMFVLEYPEFYVLGWNNSTSQLTDEGMEAVLSIWNSGKPIILATHVPINSIVDTSLPEAAANADPENRKKLWGDGCLYQPCENTSTFLGMIYDTNSPIKAVFSGHLHFRHKVQLTEQTVEYVLAPAFEGNIAKIIIK